MDSPKLMLSGRVNSVRVAGSKLVFFDLLQDGYCVQGLCNFRVLSETGVTPSGFKRFYQTLRRGDIISKPLKAAELSKDCPDPYFNI